MATNPAPTMRTHLTLLASTISLAVVTLLSAAAAPKAQNPRSEPAGADAAAADDYPLKTCVVSNETLSADYIAYTHTQSGKPDVTFRLCCESCIEELRQDPAKFLKKLEDAKAAAKAKPVPPASKRG